MVDVAQTTLRSTRGTKFVSGRSVAEDSYLMRGMIFSATKISAGRDRGKHNIRIEMIKATISKPDSDYPKIMVSTNDEDLIVLFTSQDTGTVLKTSDMWSIGQHRTDWLTRIFRPVGYTVCLSNG